MKKNGFTLIELMIVISTIALLAVSGMVVYSTILKNSRDKAREQDLTTIRQALELYRADQKIYPTSISFGGTLESSSGVVYLQTVPKDPLTSQTYAYRAYGDVVGGTTCDNITTYCKAYALCAKKQGTSGTACPVTTLSCGAGILCDIGVSSY